MSTKRIFYSGFVIVLLIFALPITINFSTDRDKTTEANQLSVSREMIREITSIKAIGPINITHNDNFSTVGFIGSGTPSLPYVLKDTNIVSVGPTAINITNTTAHFCIENVMVSGSTDVDAAGISLKNVTNGQIIRTIVTNCYRGLLLEIANITIRDNSISNIANSGIHVISRMFNSVIAGNSITNSGTAIALISSDYNIIANNTISNILNTGIGPWGTGCGIYVPDSSFNEIVNNTINDVNRHGILIGEISHGNDVINNTISNAGSHGVIVFHYTGSTTISGNSITDVVGRGISIEAYCNDAIITNNTIINAGQQGIRLWHGDQANVTRNFVYNSTGFGIELDTLANDDEVKWNSFIQNNQGGPQAYDNGSDNVFLYNYWNDWVTPDNNYDNVVDLPYNITGDINNSDPYPMIPITITIASNTGPYGFKAAGFSGNGTAITPYIFKDRIIDGIDIKNTDAYFRIENVTVIGSTNEKNGCISLKNVINGSIINTTVISGYNGIYLENACHNTLIDNDASYNSWNGIVLIGASNFNHLERNNVTGNTLHGFHLDGSNDNTMLDNLAEKNGYNGINLINASSFNNLTGNIVMENMQHGVHLDGSNNNTLFDNIANKNVDYGFSLFEASKNTLTRNTASENAIGFSLDGASHNNTLTRNSALNNTGYGFILFGSIDNLIYYNFFIVNNQYGTSQGFDATTENSWTNSTHGNYYSDYQGEDTGGDGIGDTANYTLGTGLDFKPLVFESLIDLSTLQLAGPGDITIEAGSMDYYSISWFPTTNFLPTGYTLYRESELIISGHWISGRAIELAVNVTNLVQDTMYNYTFVVSDHSGKTVSRTVWVTLKDTTVPEILYIGPSEITFEAGSTGNNLAFTFMVSDRTLDTFTMYNNGSALFTWSWPPETPERIITEGDVTLLYSDVIEENYIAITGSITTNLDELTAGVHLFEFTVNDSSGNVVSASITITVTSGSSNGGSASSGWMAPLVILTLVIQSNVLSKRRRRKQKLEKMTERRFKS